MKRQAAHTPSAAALTRLILETFRLNGLLLAAGDRLVAPLGLTSARWQVLGTVALAERPEPVPHIARTLGVSRQNVQRIVNDLVAAGALAYRRNPHHKRAQLVVLTAEGEAAYAQTLQRQAPWADRLAEGISVEEIEAAHGLLSRLRTRLEAEAEPLT